MKGADLLVKALENEGVKYVFALPGEEVRDLMVALKNSPIELVMVRHEQGAAFMADLYGRLSGKPAVCLATLGPGATNLMTGLVDAFQDRSPVVAVTGQGGLARLHKESHQVIDLTEVYSKISKWTGRIVDPKSIPEMVRKAFKRAEMEKPGPTLLELPEDLAGMEIGEEVAILKRTVSDPTIASESAIQKAVAAIQSAKRPVVIVGNGAVRGTKPAAEAFRAFIRQTNIPVIATFMGKGAISDREPQSLMTMGLGASKKVFDVLKAADLAICVGYDIVEYGPEKWNKTLLPIVHIDTEPAEVYKQYAPVVELVGDIATNLDRLTPALTQKETFPEAAEYRQAIEARWHRVKTETKTLTPEYILHTIRDLIADEDVVISDVGAHKMWTGSQYPTYAPNTVQISNGFCPMGFSLPGAIGAKLALPHRKIVSVNGDGGVLMNIQELETAKRLGVAFPVVIFNDFAYSLIEEKFRNENAVTDPLKITNPDFQALAESFGLQGVTVKTLEELKPALEFALACDTVCLVNIHIDTEANQGLFKG